jgi:2-haloacid dehalogenase
MTQALILEVYGTSVDWSRSVPRVLAEYLPEVDATNLALAWREEYDPAMARIRDGQRGYVPLEELHLENLLTVAHNFGVTLDDATTLNLAWEQLDPWPDVVSGLNALKKQVIVAPCSNGSIALMTRLARNARLPWDCILGAELAQDYKPNAQVYLKSCSALRLPPEEVTMVAAHNKDLRAAKALGLKTAFVPRIDEYGSGQTVDLEPEENWDIIAADFINLAAQIGLAE